MVVTIDDRRELCKGTKLKIKLSAKIHHVFPLVSMYCTHTLQGTHSFDCYLRDQLIAKSDNKNSGQKFLETHVPKFKEKITLGLGSIVL